MNPTTSLLAYKDDYQLNYYSLHSSGKNLGIHSGQYMAVILQVILRVLLPGDRRKVWYIMDLGWVPSQKGW